MTKSGWVLALLALCGASLWAAPSGNTLFSVEYFYADNGMVTGRKINGDMQHYRYDKRGQLLSVTDAKGQILERYSYDPAGNILAKTIYGQTTTYTYDAANQLVTSTVDGRTTRYEYDAAGRLIKEGNKEYKYGYLDKVLAVQENGRITAAFDYHMDGQIASAMTDKGDESFLWDGLALIRRNDTNLVNEPYATGGNPIVSGNDVLFNDMLGSTLGVKGQQNARISMTAFGSVRRTAESAAQAPADAYGAEPDVYFTGKPQVDGLGYAFLFRNYRSEQGKWQTQDPLGYPDGWNNFAYVNNGVTSLFDWLGGKIVTDAKGLDILDGGKWKNTVQNALNDLNTVPDINNIVTSLENYGYDITIKQSDKWPQTSSSGLGGNVTIDIDNKSYQSSARQYSFSQALLWELMNAYARVIMLEPNGEKEYTEKTYDSYRSKLNPNGDPYPFNSNNVMHKE